MCIVSRLFCACHPRRLGKLRSDSSIGPFNGATARDVTDGCHLKSWDTVQNVAQAFQVACHSVNKESYNRQHTLLDVALLTSRCDGSQAQNWTMTVAQLEEFFRRPSARQESRPQGIDSSRSRDFLRLPAPDRIDLL